MSQGVVRELRAHGFDARYLESGIAGWEAIDGPTARGDLLASLAGDERSRWVTRERPKIDRIACPWLVRHFIDPLAEFAYVVADEVLARAEAERAIAYDIPGVRFFSHRGERCTFDALLEDLEQGLGMYDALYAWLRWAHDEGHDARLFER